MIPASRFIVQSRHYQEWLTARTRGVTATAVALAATPAGFEQAVRERLDPTPKIPNEFMLFGSESEHEIMRHAHQEFGILPNDFLIAGLNPEHLGTPDGLSPSHEEIAEAKTGGTIPKSVPRQHRDQCLWNLWVTDANRCLYLFNQRVPAEGGGFRLALWEPVTFWIERDDKRIAELVDVAARLMEVTETIDDY